MLAPSRYTRGVVGAERHRPAPVLRTPARSNTSLPAPRSPVARSAALLPTRTVLTAARPCCRGRCTCRFLGVPRTSSVVTSYRRSRQAAVHLQRSGIHIGCIGRNDATELRAGARLIDGPGAADVVTDRERVGRWKVRWRRHDCTTAQRTGRAVVPTRSVPVEMVVVPGMRCCRENPAAGAVLLIDNAMPLGVGQRAGESAVGRTGQGQIARLIDDVIQAIRSVSTPVPLPSTSRRRLRDQEMSIFAHGAG